MIAFKSEPHLRSIRGPGGCKISTTFWPSPTIFGSEFSSFFINNLSLLLRPKNLGNLDQNYQSVANWFTSLSIFTLIIGVLLMCQCHRMWSYISGSVRILEVKSFVNLVHLCCHTQRKRHLHLLGNKQLNSTDDTQTTNFVQVWDFVVIL